MKKRLNCVLLIDDDEPTNFLSQMIIEESSCTEKIQLADSGEKALQYLSDSRETAGKDATYPWPDIIFLDINMPAMNGWEFLEQFDSLSKLQKRNIIIIMLTTSLNPDDRARSENIKCISGFENKPLNKEKFDGLMKKYFPDNY